MSKREVPLDIVRAIAILLAMGWHLNKTTSDIVSQTLLFPGLRFGWAGVDVFFVLSGFLVGRIILNEVAARGSFSKPHFFIRRAFRLWPVLYVYLIAQVSLARFPFTSFVPQIFFHVQNLFWTPIAHLWSLAVEEQFYLVAAFVLPPILLKMNKPHRLVIGLSLLITFAVVFRMISWFGGVDPQVLQNYPWFRMDCLSAGILLAVLEAHYPAKFVAIKKPAWLWFAIVLGACVGLSQVYWDMSYRPLIGFPLSLAGSVALVLLLQGRTVPRRLARPVGAFALLSNYSYSIYIWHPGVGRIAHDKIASITGWQNSWVSVLGSYVVAIGVGVFVTHVVEAPMMKLRDRWFPSAHARTAREAEVDAAESAARADP